jgi:hypothetical protein
MNAEKVENLPPPPGIIGSLRVGFDVVSSHVWLILLPIVVDSFLWLGPQLSAGKLYSSMVSSMLEILKNRPLPAAETNTLVESVELFQRFNWFSWIRTIPIGIPSLDAFVIPAEATSLTPLGVRQVIHIESSFSLLGWFFLLILAGWVGGSFYFRLVSIKALGREVSTIGMSHALIQTFVLSALWILCLSIVLIPVMLIVGVASLINPVLANAALFVIVLLSYWLIVPFFFMPYGIFVRKFHAFQSLYASMRMSRFTLPSSGLFVFAAIVLTRGLNFLWSVPESDSWMRFVGISGHAFISTTLLAAGFVYYRDLNVWLQTLLDQLQQKQSVQAH